LTVTDELGLSDSLQRWLDAPEPVPASEMRGLAMCEDPRPGFAVDKWRDSGLGSTVSFCLDRAAVFGVQDARQICRVLMTVLQTLSAQSKSAAERNLQLAGRYTERGRRRLVEQENKERLVDVEDKERGRRFGVNQSCSQANQSPVPSGVRTHDLPDRVPSQADCRKIFREPVAALAPEPPGASHQPSQAKISDPPLPEARELQSRQPYTVRADESGAGVRSDQLVLWHASHIGPRYAEKGENQDATFAAECHGGLVFALADGVSTSMGSRYAAAASVFQFCRFAKENLSKTLPPGGSCLVEAARATQVWMDELLSYLLEHPDAPDMGDIRGEIGRDVALRLLKNTQNPTKRVWGAAMASTLVGGLIRPEDDGGSFHVELLRIGDGLVERVSRTGDVQVILGMDSEETEISGALGPGPASKRAVDAATPKQETLRANELLLVSSDGLARGHTESVGAKLTAIDGDFHKTLDPARESAAHQILVAAAQFADDSFQRDPGTHLFNDNLSLIVIAPVKGWR
jgi:hypothetical protein